MKMVKKDSKVLIVSPHCDDSILSLGGAILNRDLGENISVYDVFSISNYTIKEPGTGDWKKITSVRHQEEMNVSKQLNTKVKFIGFKEPLLREGYNTMEDIFNPATDPAKDKIWEKIYGWGKGVCKEENWDYIFFPLGIGHHIDHKILTQVGLNLQKSNTAVPILFYEDLPYAGGEKLEAITEHMKKLDKSLVPILIPLDNLEEKMKTLGLYASQFDSEDTEWTYRHTIRLKGERIWTYPTFKNLLIRGKKR